MTAVFFPILSAGTAASLTTPSFALPLPRPPTGPPPPPPPPACRYAGEPVRWVHVAGGIPIQAFARSAVRTYSENQPGVPGSPGAQGTLIELTPLPGFGSAVFKALNGGLPVMYVLVPASPAPTFAIPTSQDVCLSGGQAVLTTAAGSEGWFGICFQDRLVRDAAAWGREMSAALIAAGADAGTWPAFVAMMEALAPGPPIYALDHVGRPLTSGSLTVDAGSGATAVTLTAAADGNTGLALPAGGRATITFTSAAHPVVAGGEHEGGALDGPYQLAADERFAQLLDADLWFANRTPGVTNLPRWHPNSAVEPIVDGNPYFARLVPDLRSTKGGGHAYLAGWAFVKEGLIDPTVEWPLIPGDDSTRLLALAQELVSGNAELRFLVNKFLQLDVDPLDDASPAMLILIAIFAGLMPLQAFQKLATDPAGFGMLLLGIGAAGLILSTASWTQSLLESLAEPSKGTLEALQAINPAVATWAPYPARTLDNPIATWPLALPAVTIDDVSHFGVYHQKLVLTHSGDNHFAGYVGGIDINSDRVDSPIHRAIFPFHDVQARLTGPAVADLAQTIMDRMDLVGSSHTLMVPDPIPDGAGAHLVQIGRTYFEPAATSGTPPFPFAPHGETTTHETLMQAIRAARDFIYIEDQYFTPDAAFLDELVNAADASRGVRALVITVPTQTDQPFGSIRRSAAFARLASAWGSRLQVGAPLRRYLVPTPAANVSLGRCILKTEVSDDGLANRITIGPVAHVPDPPFWVYVEGELMRADSTSGPPDMTPDPDSVDSGQTLNVVRGPASSTDPQWGANVGRHDKGSPALCVRIPGIYIHAKIMVIDDVFVSIGSSNMNRRGYFHDGEINCLAIPQHLKRDPANPARILRCRLWAEHLGLPPEIGLSLFLDPLSSLPYFARPWQVGSRWQPLSWTGSAPPDVPIGSSASFVGELLKLAIGIGTDLYKDKVWRTVADPTCPTDPNGDAAHGGPELP